MHVQYFCVGSGATKEYTVLSVTRLSNRYRFTILYQLKIALLQMCVIFIFSDIIVERADIHQPLLDMFIH